MRAFWEFLDQCIMAVGAPPTRLYFGHDAWNRLISQFTPAERYIGQREGVLFIAVHHAGHEIRIYRDPWAPPARRPNE